ncbi:tyrosine-protein kinase transmembrane receptor ROR1-like [Sarcoptes scabiei]|nr:tyrosine-protein kinase transmembrane receptor ROR1-like [Sarcoptes scabiei]
MISFEIIETSLLFLRTLDTVRERECQCSWLFWCSLSENQCHSNVFQSQSLSTMIESIPNANFRFFDIDFVFDDDVDDDDDGGHLLALLIATKSSKDFIHSKLFQYKYHFGFVFF